MKLNQTQRNYLLSELIAAMFLDLKKRLSKIKNKDFNVDSGMRMGAPGKTVDKFWCETRYDYDIFTEKACAGEEVFKDWFRVNWKPTREWYQEQIDAGAYEVETEFSECMVSPRFKVKLTNYEKEKKKAAHNWRKRAAAIRALISEVQYEVMEANNFYEKAKRRIMLADNTEASDLLDELIKEFKNS